MRSIQSALRRLQRGNAGDYFTHENIMPGDLLVIACRVSTHEQNRTEKLNRQVSNLRDYVSRRGGKIIDEITHVGSGWDPAWLGNAAQIALEHGAKILFETVNRAIRSTAYHSQDIFDAQARTIELEDLRWWTQGVELVTLLPPDASASEERSFATRRGQAESGNKGGRPKKRNKSPNASNETIAEAREMKRNGASHTEIMARFNAPKSTVQSWVQGVEKGGTKRVENSNADL